MSIHTQAIKRKFRRKLLSNNSDLQSTQPDHFIKKQRNLSYPEHNNRIKVWIMENRPELTHFKSVSKFFEKSLAEYGISHTMFSRWLANTSGITLDELHIVASVIGANLRDLI